MASLAIALGLWVTQATVSSLNLSGLIARLQVADTSQVPRLLEQIDKHGERGQASLAKALTASTRGGREEFLLLLGQVTNRHEQKACRARLRAQACGIARSGLGLQSA